MERHRSQLDPESTWYLNLDTLGSPRLAMLEGEGPVWMEDYDEGFRDRLMASPITTTWPSSGASAPAPRPTR